VENSLSDRDDIARMGKISIAECKRRDRKFIFPFQKSNTLSSGLSV